MRTVREIYESKRISEIQGSGTLMRTALSIVSIMIRDYVNCVEVFTVISIFFLIWR